MIRPQSIRGMGREADQRVRLGVGLCLQVHLELRPAVYKQGALLANLQVMCRTRSAQGRTTAVTQPPPQPYHSRHLNFSTAATSTLPQPSPQLFHSRHLNNTTAATSTLPQPPPQLFHSRHLNLTTAVTSTFPQPPPQQYHSRHLNLDAPADSYRGSCLR